MLGVSRDYAPSNIMYDRRIIRGNTYASMVVPATTAPNKGKIKETTKRQDDAGKTAVIRKYADGSSDSGGGQTDGEHARAIARKEECGGRGEGG